MGLHRPRAFLVAMLITVLGSCSDSDDGPTKTSDPLSRLRPTGPLPLSPGNEAGRDEDPAIVIAGDADREIFVMVHDGSGWTLPAPAAGVNSDLHHDTFPHVVENASGGFLMTWTRYDLSEGDNLFNASTKTMLSTSTDGLSRATPS